MDTLKYGSRRDTFSMSFTYTTERPPDPSSQFDFTEERFAEILDFAGRDSHSRGLGRFLNLHTCSGAMTSTCRCIGRWP